MRIIKNEAGVEKARRYVQPRGEVPPPTRFALVSHRDERHKRNEAASTLRCEQED